MGIAAILVMRPEHFVQFRLTYQKESSYEIWVQMALWNLRKLFNV